MAPATSDFRLGQRRVRGDQTLNEGRTFAEPDERAVVVATGDRDLAPRAGRGISQTSLAFLALILWRGTAHKHSPPFGQTSVGLTLVVAHAARRINE
jgi:hypothetical protein